MQAVPIMSKQTEIKKCATVMAAHFILISNALLNLLENDSN